MMRIVATAVICAVALVGARRDRAVAAQPTDWPMYLHDISRTSDNQADSAISPFTAPHLAKVWSYKTGGISAASPVVADNFVFIGSWDGYMYSLRAGTGQMQWRTYLGVTNQPAACTPPAAVGITSSATVDSGVVYVAGGGPYFYALDELTGAIRWQVFTGDNSTSGGHFDWSSPLVCNGYAYYGVASLCDTPLVQGQVLRINLTTHLGDGTFNVVPNTQVGGGVWGSPTIDPASNTLFFTTGNEDATASLPEPYARAIVAIDSNTMTFKSAWQNPFGVNGDNDWGPTPVLITDINGRKLVTATSKDGNVYAFNRADLSTGPVWNTQIAWSGPDPTLGDGSLLVGVRWQQALRRGRTFTLNSVNVPGTVAALDPATSNVVWQRAPPGIVFAAVAFADRVFFDGGGANVEARAASTGTVLYSYTTGGTIYGPPTIAEGRLYEGSTDGTVYAFAPPAAVGGAALAVNPASLPTTRSGSGGRCAAIVVAVALVLASCGLALWRRRAAA